MSGGLGLSIPYREKRRTNRPTATRSRGAGGQTIRPPERSAKRVRRSPYGRAFSPLTTSRNAADLRRRSDSPKNLYVQIRGARRNLRPPFVCSSRATGPCLPRTNRRFPPPVRCAAKFPPAANAPTNAQKRPAVPNWNSVKKKILAARCNIVYICVCGCNSAPAKRKAGLLWR